MNQLKFGGILINQGIIYIIDDLSLIFQELLSKECSNIIFNIALGKSYAVSEIIKVLEKYLSKKAVIKLLPENKQDVDHIHFDVSLLKRILIINL